MTDYEKLSLTLLAHIATGISHQLTALNPAYAHAGSEPHEQILAWQKSLESITELVAGAVASPAAA